MISIISFLKKKGGGIFSLSFTHVLNICAGIVTLPIILSTIPISEYGQWQFFLALHSWGLVMSAQQITDGSKRGLALGQDGTFFYALFKRGKLLLISSILFFLLALFFFSTSRDILSDLAGLSALYLFSNLLIQTSVTEYFTAKKEFFLVGLWDIISSPFARIGSALVAFFSHSIFYFVLFQIIYATSISLFVILFLIYKRNLWQQYKQKNYDPSCVNYGIRFIPIDLLSALSNRMVEILIGIFFGFSNLAFFSVARDVKNQITNLLKIAGPLLYADFVRQPFEKLTVLVHRHLWHAIVTSTLLGATGVGLGMMYILYFLPEAFHVSIPLFFLLSLALPVALPTFLFFTILNSHFRYRAVAAATMIPNLIEIISVTLFGWLWGIPGMTFAITLFGFISFAFFYLATIKRQAFKIFLERSKFMRRLMGAY